MNNIKANETIVSRSVVDLMEEMLKSVENEQEENQLINTATNAIEINNEEQKNEIINTKEQTNSIVDIKKDNNEVINTKVEHKSQNNKDESNDDNINEEKKKRKEMNKKKFNEKTKEVQRGSKRKMIESKEECRLSSSSDESITILGHSDHNTNPQSLFTDYSPICLRINRDEKGNKRLKNKCQSFKKHTLCVIKSMIGPQSPASHNGMFIICPPAKLTCEIETFSEKMKRMRRTAVRKEVCPEMLLSIHEFVL